MSTIVMTGGTSGFGAIVSEWLTRSTGARLILGARRPTSASESVGLDLTRLESVRTFAASVRERLGDTPIDALVLNAGVVLPDVGGRTVDGFETTFAVNHLAHYLLLRLLLPALADNGIVVLTTSGTHDPATGAGLAPPRHADAELLAHPDRDPGRDPSPRRAGQQAYTASKLCAVLTARSLSEHPDVQTRRITVVAFCPGQVFGTGLARSLPFPLRIAWSLLGTPLGGRCAHCTAISTAAPRQGAVWLTWRSASRYPRPSAPTPRCDEDGSPGRLRRNWRVETSWRSRCGTTALGWSACRTMARDAARGSPSTHGPATWLLA